ncbi:hypothetical protein CPC735_011530 [Coccidioides posadasii C735 delta SOWgp]|nr:hypothetical protein CPC735_011530 [Coccidioides posadasii C735 delta SOWgp]EER29835.1 hypothetical protein CPC735_011530 [Coccidioides posadasii C735 delta SOWgp]|eukprot:XP_003071980.1 hypothetical protein CPC735_011530 [Coccidioides posadasii C735 delta SOWgp]
MPPTNAEKVPSEAQSSVFFNTQATLREETSTTSPWQFFQKKGSVPQTTAPIPQISVERQRAAAHDHALNVGALLEEERQGKEPLKAKTVLYLAYGSNMSSKTFRNTRKIVPISQLNVCVPDLTLTFDLPGVPYFEPCFAATQYRDPVTGEPKYPNGHFTHQADGRDNDEADDDERGALLRSDDSALDDTNVWRKPLVGVVYEVTLSDYARIIATEGGGSSYIDVVVDCYPFPADFNPSDPVPSHPSTIPFRAHTLLAPARDTANACGKTGSNNGNSHLVRHPTYAQPSPRYMSLLVIGAKEHNLPDSYRTYLSSLHAYRITSRRQRLGQVLLCLLWVPSLLLVMTLARILADNRGRAPGWLAKLQRGLFGSIWWTYDVIFRKVFGDGERTAGT